MSDSVRLRPMEAADWAAVHTWASRREYCRFQPWGPNTEQQTREFVAESVAAWSQNPQTAFVYAVLIGEKVIGNGELNVQQPRFRRGAIGYGLHPDAWGRGYGTAIGRELLRIGFQEVGLHRIDATCDPRNLGSAAVLRKIGMTYEGRQRQTMLISDGWRDSEMFSMLEDEWRAG